MSDLPEHDPRVYLAAERTLLAWIRTGMAMMGFGFVVARFGIFLQELQPSRGGPSPHGSLWFGTALVLMGVSVNVVAALQHTRLVHRLRHRTWSPTPSRAGLALALGLALVGLAVAVHILWLAAGVR